MTAIEWSSKLAIECNEFYRVFIKWPQAIYMGYKEVMDYRANIPPNQLYSPDDVMRFQGIEIITVCKNSYFRVI